MKLVDEADATASLAEYAAQIENGPVIVTHQGRPVAALMPIENADLETVTLSTNPKFLEMIERSRSRIHAEGGISSDEMRRRLQSDSTIEGASRSWRVVSLMHAPSSAAPDRAHVRHIQSPRARRAPRVRLCHRLAQRCA